MTIARTFRLLTLGAAKVLTQAQLPFGMQEGQDVTDRWGV
jgi:hypothetical protein